VSGTPGVFSPIHPILQAITSFAASRTPCENPALRVIVSYLRGAGLSIIPEIFDTHEEAAKDLREVARNAAVAEDAGKLFLQELRLKAMFHLARMFVEDENRERSRGELRRLEKTGGATFYGKWASKQLKQLDRREEK
jgi:hypothetical protein